MKKQLLIATAVCASFAGAAHAQSSVTLYGTLDESVGYFSNVVSGGTGKLIGLHPAGQTPNLWGLRGTEDLGNGLSTVFDLEDGFNGGTGAAQGGLFGRQAFVGLQSKTLGTLTFGRQYDPSVDLVQPLTNDAAFGSAFATPGDIDNYDNSYSTANAVKFQSVAVKGFQVEGFYAFGNVAGQTGSGQTVAAAASYANGPVGVAASYLRATSSSTPSFGELNGGNVGADSTAISGEYAGAKSTQIIRVAGDYTYNAFTAGLTYSNVAYSDYATNAGLGSTRFNTYQGFVNYQATTALLLGLGYDYTKGYGNQVNVAYQQLSLGATYGLSKRTNLYAVGGFQHTTGKSYDNGVLVDAPASFADYGEDSAKRTQGVVLVGIRHNF
jgi:predicted porin